MTLLMLKNSQYWQVLKSVAASMFGAQSHKNYQTDFKQPSFIPYLSIGIVFVVCLVLLLITIVNLVV
jgi:DMSO/TMAO reductase YedYZ heme-binding membrane subunit